ncbi:MAG: hypothetical protein ACI8R9_002890, partial [Paraglaciecola sp.]
TFYTPVVRYALTCEALRCSENFIKSTPLQVTPSADISLRITPFEFIATSPILFLTLRLSISRSSLTTASQKLEYSMSPEKRILLLDSIAALAVKVVNTSSDVKIIFFISILQLNN